MESIRVSTTIDYASLGINCGDTDDNAFIKIEWNNMLCGCHIYEKLCKKDISYTVLYPTGLYELKFCSEECRNQYINRHIAEFYRGVPIYQQFNFQNGETAYILDYLSGNYSLDIQSIRDYIDENEILIGDSVLWTN